MSGGVIRSPVLKARKEFFSGVDLERGWFFRFWGREGVVCNFVCLVLGPGDWGTGGGKSVE